MKSKKQHSAKDFLVHAVHSPRTRLYVSFFLVGLASVVRGGEWIIFVALVPFLTYLPHMFSYSNKVVRRDFYWASFIVCGFAYAFLFQMAPQNWTVALTGWFGFVSRALAWVLVSFFCAISFWVVGLLLLRIKDFNRQLVALPFIWILGEIIRTYLFAVMSYGPGGSLSPNFNWGSIAVSAAGTPLVYASRYVGFFGLSALVVVINIAIYLVVSRRKYLLGLCLLLAIGIISYTGWVKGGTQSGSMVSVSLVHLSERDDLELWDDIPWPKDGTDILVLPEYSEFLSNPDKQKIASKISEQGIGITTVSDGISPDATNQITYFNNRANVLNKQDKTFLIPTGEFIPYSLQAGFWAMAQDRVMEDFRGSQQLKRGSTPEVPYDKGSILVGALACSGVNALSEYSRLTKDGAEVLVNSASLSFLTSKSLYHVYAHNMARYQAVSNNRPFIQASRSGESYIIDNQGRFITSYRGDETKLLQANIEY